MGRQVGPRKCHVRAVRGMIRSRTFPVSGVMKRIEVALTENGGQVDNVDNWGKRKLAYEIDKLTEGDYTLVNFHADPTQIAELDRVLRINDAVKRHMIVRRPDHE